jgi:hypothetical protein
MMRQPNHASRGLPPEWLEAIREAHNRGTPADRAGPVARKSAPPPRSPETYIHTPELQDLVARLKSERIAQGLSLGDISRMTRQARSAISRLESGEFANPTLNTLYRYALAVGWHVRFVAEPLKDGHPPAHARRNGTKP